jgi:hypothetical protein
MDQNASLEDDSLRFRFSQQLGSRSCSTGLWLSVDSWLSRFRVNQMTQSSALKTETVRLSETLISAYEFTRCHNPEVHRKCASSFSQHLYPHTSILSSIWRMQTGNTAPSLNPCPDVSFIVCTQQDEGQQSWRALCSARSADSLIR